MNIISKQIEEIIPYEKNPRNNDAAVDPVACSIRDFGFKVPIVIDASGVIVAGHTRYRAAKKLGLETIPCIVAEDLTDEQIRAFRLADNKTAEKATWDINRLAEELLNIEIDMSEYGFDVEDVTVNEYNDIVNPSLIERFIVPPFSILDTRQGYWQDRKREWKRIIKSDDGRDESLLGNGLRQLAEKQGAALTGTSIFDPVLCEIMINWFCPIGGHILDPFAGGSVRGLIASFLGREYTGVDLSQRQITANLANYEKIKNLDADMIQCPNWIVGDSADIDTIVDGRYDFMLTCPPYADLEVYSDDPRDISNMNYSDFIDAYKKIINKSIKLLNDNAFFVIVVGEVRDKKGYYYNFVGDTIDICKRAGAHYYNELILIEQIATASVRAGRQFTASRKVAKTHQNVLVFVKGDWKKVFPMLDKEYADLTDLI